jgi:hypothetical protein
MSLWTRYDYLNGKELKKEATRRFGTNKGKKPALPINRNQAGYKYRILLIEDDLRKGINPYHNNSSPSDVDSLVQPQRPWVSEPSLPSSSSAN